MIKKVTSDRINVATDTASSVPDSRIRSEAIFTKFLNKNLKIKITPSLLEQRQSSSVPDSAPNLASETVSSAASAKDVNGIFAKMQEVAEEINSGKSEVNFLTRIWVRIKAIFQRRTSGDREVAKLYFQKIRNKEAFLAATANFMLRLDQRNQLNENMNILVSLLRSLEKQEIENLMKPLVHGGLPLPEAVQLMKEITSRMGNAYFIKEVFSYMEDFIVDWVHKLPLPEAVQLMKEIVSQIDRTTCSIYLRNILGKGLNAMIDAYARLETDAVNAIAPQMLELCQKCKEHDIRASHRPQPEFQDTSYGSWLQTQTAADEKLTCAFENYLLGNGSKQDLVPLLKMAMIAVQPTTQWFGFNSTPANLELSALLENEFHLEEMRSSLALNGTNVAENIAAIRNLLDRADINEKVCENEFVIFLRKNSNIMSIISKMCSDPLNQYPTVFAYLLKYRLSEPFGDFLASSLKKAEKSGATAP